LSDWKRRVAFGVSPASYVFFSSHILRSKVVHRYVVILKKSLIFPETKCYLLP
jgi:hypothetical protein